MKPLLAALALVALAAPAQATEWLYCSDAAGEAEIGILLGHHTVLVPVGVTLRGPGPVNWSSNPAYGEGEPISIGQAFGDDDMVLVDLLDGDVNLPVASLRVFRALEGKVFAQGGTLTIVGLGAWAVSCEGP
jgi:hypothetical protein